MSSNLAGQQCSVSVVPLQRRRSDARCVRCLTQTQRTPTTEHGLLAAQMGARLRPFGSLPISRRPPLPVTCMVQLQGRRSGALRSSNPASEGAEFGQNRLSRVDSDMPAHCYSPAARRQFEANDRCEFNECVLASTLCGRSSGWQANGGLGASSGRPTLRFGGDADRGRTRLRHSAQWPTFKLDRIASYLTMTNEATQNCLLCDP
ncbi:hypothetical protein OKW49_008495 [Paraburkholderia youngii]